MKTFESIVKHRPEEFIFTGVRADEDPLRVVDALREAQILDVWSECVTQSIGILLEMRMAFAGGGNRAALVIGRGVADFGWKCFSPWSSVEMDSFGKAWNVAGSLVTPSGLILKLELDCIPDARLDVSSQEFEYYLADVPGLSLAPPDYCEGPDDLIRDNLPDWKRPITIVGASRRAAE